MPKPAQNSPELIRESLKHLRHELSIVARVLYKTRNQQRRMHSFRHLQAVKKHGSALLTREHSDEEVGRLVGEMLVEVRKSGELLLWNLQMGFFTSGSVVLQASLARIDYLLCQLN